MAEKIQLHGELFDLLKTFSRKEIKTFSEFLDSPYHTKSTNCVRSFTFIKKFYPLFDNSILSLKNIHNFVNPTKKFHELTVRNILSDLYALALRFIALENYFSEDHIRHNTILKELNDRKLVGLFDKYAHKLDEFLKGNQKWCTEYFIERFRTKALLVQNEQLHRIDRGTQRDFNKIFRLYDDAFDDLNSYYISYLIQMYINLKLYELTANIDVRSVKLIKYLNGKIEKYLGNQTQSYLESNVGYLLALKSYYAFRYFNDHTHYIDYKEMYIKFCDRLTTDEMLHHLITLQEYCGVKRNNSDDPREIHKFTNEILSLNSLRFSKGLYGYGNNKYIDPVEFRALIVISVNSMNLEWVNDLVINYLNKLQEKVRDPLKNLAFMYINFYKKNYEASMEFANKINLRLQYLRFDVINTKLRIFYETKKYDTCLDLVRTFQNVLGKSPYITEIKRERNINFIKVVRNLVFIHLGKKQLDNKFVQELKLLVPQCNYNDWLSEKFEEILSQIKFGKIKLTG